MKGIDDFSRPEEYISPFDRHFRRVMRNHLETWVMPERRRYDEDWKDHRLIGPAFDRLMVDLGLQKALFPQEHGGWGLAKSDSVFRVGYMLCEELGRADTVSYTHLTLPTTYSVYISVVAVALKKKHNQ